MSKEKLFPNLSGVDHRIADTLRQLWDAVHYGSGKSGDVSIGSGMNISGVVTAKNSDTPAENELITKKYVDENYSASVMSKNLSSTGSNPMNLSGLTGYPNCSFSFGIESLRPSTGSSSGQIYFATDTKKITMWDGSTSSWTHILNTL